MKFCPCCRDGRVAVIGEIPQLPRFAGYSLPLGPNPVRLGRCLNCHLYFKYPILERAESNSLYESGNAGAWVYKLEERQDWQMARDLIRRNLSGGAILDVGCWSGEFLKNMGKDWQLFGVEINSVAARQAIAKGIDIVTKDFYDLETLNADYDVVTAFDVLEHTADPYRFLGTILNLCKDNGLILVSSGNTDALTWKLSGSKYWYCSIPEHICFLNRAWYEYAVKRLNLRIEFLAEFSHGQSRRILYKAGEAVQNLLYLYIPLVFNPLRCIKHIAAGVFFNKRTECFSQDYPPLWMTSKDHLFMAFRKGRP